ncbi:hypothetical protein J7K43_06425 [Candidatus Calescamantes bacterium]|nr:hypothetical protein [Candidatus Calescamantes bacterium]
MRRLNRNLPEGIRVIEKEGRQIIVNKKDGYEIKVPEKWGELEGVDYREVENKKIVNFEGVNGEIVEIKVFDIPNKNNIEINNWIKNRWQKLPELYINPVIIGKESINGYNVIKSKSFGGLMGELFFYYLKTNSKIYEFSSDSEESIRDVITNGSF